MTAVWQVRAVYSLAELGDELAALIWDADQEIARMEQPGETLPRMTKPADEDPGGAVRRRPDHEDGCVAGSPRRDRTGGVMAETADARRRRRLEFLALTPAEVRAKSKQRLEEYERTRAAALARDQAVCTRPGCGHKNVSHGSFLKTGEFAGIGGGQCGMEDGRYDPCPCERFVGA